MATESPTEDAVGRATHQFARFLADENHIREMPALKDYGEGLKRRIRDMLAGRGGAARAKVLKGISARRNKRRP